MNLSSLVDKYWVNGDAETREKALQSLMLDEVFRYPTNNEIEKDSIEIAERILSFQDWQPEAIIGLSRGGIVPARYMADVLGIRSDFFSLDVKRYSDNLGETPSAPEIRNFNDDVRGKKCLIVDDIWDSGETMAAVLEVMKGEDVKTATIYIRELSDGSREDFPDFSQVIAEKDTWIVFPWEKREFRRQVSKLWEDKAKSEDSIPS
jgi:hypoxanthine phosphoribosyltransferase